MNQITSTEENRVAVSFKPLDKFRAGLAADRFAPLSAALTVCAVVGVWASHQYLGSALAFTIFGPAELARWIARNIKCTQLDAVSFDDATVTLQSNQIESLKLGWLAIRGIENSRDYILIHADAFRIYPIPKRCFSSADSANAFAARMFDTWRAATSAGHEFALCRTPNHGDSYLWLPWLIATVSVIGCAAVPALVFVSLFALLAGFWVFLQDRMDRVRYEVASISLARGDFPQAWQKIRKALNVLNRNPEAFVLGMNMQLHFKDYKKAVKLANEALKRDPRNPNAFRGRGTAYELLGEYEKAAADRKIALALSPHWAGAPDMQGIETSQPLPIRSRQTHP